MNALPELFTGQTPKNHTLKYDYNSWPSNKRYKTLEMVIEGKTYEDISEELGIPKDMIRESIGRFGFDLANKMKLDHGIDKERAILIMRLNGFTYRDIAKEVNLTHQRIEQIIKKNFGRTLDFTEISKFNRITRYFLYECRLCHSEYIAKKDTRLCFCSSNCKSGYLAEYGVRDESPRILLPNGRTRKRYKMKYIGKSNGKSKYKQEHRLIMEKHLGRPLESWEHIHHIDGNGTNNKLNNLQLLSHSEHSRLTATLSFKRNKLYPIKMGTKYLTAKELQEFARVRLNGG